MMKMMKPIHSIIFLIATIAASGQLTAQSPVNRLWHTETQFPADGFAVKNRLQNPVFGITAGVVPGPMPVVIQLQIDGGSKSWARSGFQWHDLSDGYGYMVPEAQELFRPVYGTIHFGYSPATSSYWPMMEKGPTVLEGGQTIDSTVALSSIAPGQSLSIQTDFGMQTLTGGASLSSGGNFAIWMAQLSRMGTNCQTKISQAAPVGFSSVSLYMVVVDSSMARVYRELKEYGVWVPILWVDKSDNYVTFKWERKTTGIPSGALEMGCVTIKNDEGKGAQVQWITYPDDGDTEKDLVRVDFIGMNAPSMHIKGYPGISYQAPPGMAHGLAPDPYMGIGDTTPIRPVTGGPIIRPTQITLTPNRGTLPTLPNGWAPPTQTSGETSAARTWHITYNYDKNLISTYKDPYGLTTTFAYTQGETEYPFGNDNYPNGGYTNYGPIKFTRVASASTTNGSLTATQTWAWGQSTKTVTHTSTFNGTSITTATDYSSTKPWDIVNGAWKSSKTYDGTYASGTPIATATNLETTAGGLDGTLTMAKSQEATESSMPGYKTTISYKAGNYSLLPESVILSNATGTTVKKTEYTYSAPDWGALSPGRHTSSSTTHHNANGTPLPEKTVQHSQWDGGKLTKSYISDTSSTLEWGTDYTASGGVPTGGRAYLRDIGYLTQGPTQTVSYHFTNKQPNKVTVTDSTSTYTSQITAFDTKLLPTTTIDQLGITTKTTYDDRGRVVSQSRAGITTTYTYPTELKVQTSTVPDTGGTPITATQDYDAFGRLTKTTNSAGITTTYTYQGRTTTINTNTNGVSMTQSHTVDALGRPISSQSADGALATYEYTTTGMTAGQYKVKTTHKQGMSTTTTEEVRNLLGQTLEVKEIDGPRKDTVHKYTYDGMGNPTEHKTTAPTKLTQTATQTRTFQYDGLGRLVSRTEPETGKTTFASYEVNGQPRIITEPIQTSPATNRARTITYDGFGRITNVTSGSDTLTYVYQKYKPLLDQATRKQTTGTVTQEYLYNAYAQLTSEKTKGADSFVANIQYEYDTWWDISKITYPGASSNTAGRAVFYQYGANRQIQAISHSETASAAAGATLATIGYDPLGRKQDTVFASGATNTYTYSPVTRIDKWEIKPLGQSAIERKFEYDVYGYLKNTGEWAITNDTIGRIQEATGHGVTTTHGHDNFGNNVSHSVSPAQNKMINWAFPPLTNNRIPAQTQNGAQTWWQYSENGEAAFIGKAPGGDKLQMAWDGLGLLKGVKETIGPNDNTHDFTYAPSGLRVRDKRTGTNPHDKRYVYTTSGALMSAYETIGSTTKRRDVVYANGEAIAEIDQNNNIYELHNDHLGTPRYITSRSNGQIAGQQAFGPYGEEMDGTFNGQKLPDGYKPLTGYTGHLNEDMTGLIYMKGRYYSPLWHRFINSDQGVDPNSINQFAYVGGRPFMAKDPNGMRHCITYYITIEEPGRSPGEFVFHAVDLYTICFDEGGGGVVEDMPGGGVGGGGGGGGGGGVGSGQSGQPKNIAQEGDCGAESVGQLLDRKGMEAYENGNYAAWIGLGYLNAAYKVFTPGGDSLSQLNARAWNGESISASELATTGLWATAHLGLTAAPGLANSRSFGTALHNSKIAGINFRPGTSINSGYFRLGWTRAPDSFQRFRLGVGEWKIDLFQSGVKNGVKCGPK